MHRKSTKAKNSDASYLSLFFFGILRVGGLEDEHAVWSLSHALHRSHRLILLRFFVSLVEAVCLQLLTVH